MATRPAGGVAEGAWGGCRWAGIVRSVQVPCVSGNAGSVGRCNALWLAEYARMSGAKCDQQYTGSGRLCLAVQPHHLCSVGACWCESSGIM